MLAMLLGNTALDGCTFYFFQNGEKIVMATSFFLRQNYVVKCKWNLYTQLHIIPIHREVY